MRFFEARRGIAAGPDKVWTILTDAQRLVRGFGITRIEGRIAPGGRLKLWSEASPGRAFALRVTAFEPPRRMVWSGGMPLGLFTGTRVFSLAPRPDGGTDFTLREDYTGPLAGLIFKSIPDLQPSFEIFADTLRKEAEA